MSVKCTKYKNKGQIYVFVLYFIYYRIVDILYIYV